MHHCTCLTCRPSQQRSRLPSAARPPPGHPRLGAKLDPANCYGIVTGLGFHRWQWDGGAAARLKKLIGVEGKAIKSKYSWKSVTLCTEGLGWGFRAGTCLSDCGASQNARKWFVVHQATLADCSCCPRPPCPSATPKRTRARRRR
jgi:hypothetical protein